MKKVIIKAISVALVFVLSVLALSSCGWYPFGNPSIFPEGYTGGFGIGYGSSLEIYWVETYEEAVEAINLLKSHGSTFEEMAIFSYEGDLFDTKYCFEINGDMADYVKYGDNPYDRWAKDVRVASYAFFEDVTIDELVYSNVMFYDISYIWGTEYLEDYHNNIDFSSVELRFGWEERYDETSYCVYYGDDLVLLVHSFNDFKPSYECVEVMCRSVEFIGFDDLGG